MSGYHTMAFFDGDSTQFLRRFGVSRWRKPAPTATNNEHTALKKLPRIKLPRTTVLMCKDGLSDGFSHTDDLIGQDAIIWCTGDNSGFVAAYVGTIKRGTSHIEHQYVLAPHRRITRGEFKRIVAS